MVTIMGMCLDVSQSWKTTPSSNSTIVTCLYGTTLPWHRGDNAIAMSCNDQRMSEFLGIIVPRQMV